MLESVVFANACLEKIGEDTRINFLRQLAAGVPTLRTVSFGAELHQVINGAIIPASATPQTVGVVSDI